MNTATISSRFNIAIPKEICDFMKIKPGERVQVLQYDNRIELIPLKTLKEMRGFLNGTETTVIREEDRV